jgi:phage terminase small subunit
MAILEPLSYKQQKFCEEYLLNFNAYRAALSAGYTDNTARKGDLLHVPKIQAYLKEAMKRSAARAELTHDMLLRELMKVAFCNMGNYYDDRGNPKRMHQLTDDEKSAISYFQLADVTEDDGHIRGEMFKIKLHNKMAAIDKLCKHTGFYKAKWEPAAVADMRETAEDIAFEAECAKTPPECFTEEVQEELFEQMFGGEVGGQRSDVGEGQEDSGSCSDEWQEDVRGQRSEVGEEQALQMQTQVKHSLQTSASDVLEENQESRCKNQDEDVAENILTLTPFEESQELRCKSQDNDMDVNILTLSPFKVAESGKHKAESIRTAPVGRWSTISAAERLKQLKQMA